MKYIYVLKSAKNGKQYVGLTGKDPEVRLREHNEGVNRFTRHNRPFELIYSEKFQDDSFARKREKFLKSGSGRSFLKKKLAGDSLK